MIQDVVSSVNKSIEDTIDAIDTRFVKKSVENLEAISKVVDTKRNIDHETIEHLANKYPSFITIKKFEKEAKCLKELKAQYSMLNKMEFAGILSANFEASLPIIYKLGDM